MNEESKLKRKEYHKAYYLAHREERKQHKREYDKAYHLANKERLLAASRLYYQAHREELLRRSRERWHKAKVIALTHYGGGKCACVKCDFDDIRALSIDHIGGGGNNHRRLSYNAIKICQWLIHNNFPEGYQTLCMNCQLIKKIEEEEYGRANTVRRKLQQATKAGNNMAIQSHL